MALPQKSLDQLSIDTIRTLAIDAIQKAKSGHPGTVMALAPLAYTLWQETLRFDPADPIWPNRDRFVLSTGHASMLLYSLLHLTGTKSVDERYEVLGTPTVSLDDIKHFRQLDSKAPGHPEYHITSGVETTTGPLGQGVATSVGMAIAGLWLAERYNRPGFTVFDYNVYVICGDGDLMEGISSEAGSIAGHLKLPNLCWIYDNNHVTIEGHTDITFSEDIACRFLAYGWHVVRVSDANDRQLVRKALDAFKKTADRPTLIIVDSHIGYGSPHKQDTSAAHGEPLGEEEVRLTKRFYGWPEDAQFLVPDGVYRHFADGIGRRGADMHASWRELFKNYQKKHPDLADAVERMQKRELPEGWDKAIPQFTADPKGMATRTASGKTLNVIAPAVPWLLGGAADLDASVQTRLQFEGAGDFAAGHYGGRNFHFGVREHGMGAICNGLALSKLRSYGATYLIFSDYMKPAIRLSALMEIPVIWIYSHDSIGLGEDGPTHQPVEQLITLRAIPGLVTIRPMDANETAEAWRVIMQLKHQPSCLVLSRQVLPVVDRSHYASASGVARGAYVLADPPSGKPEVILIGTGSEVPLCLDAFEALNRDGIRARVVSMPSWDLFEGQDQTYQDSVLPPEIAARVSVEQGSTMGWERYVGRTGAKIGMHTFGASAPCKELLKKFGFTPEKVVEAAKSQLALSRERRGGQRT
jgi:transketolase